MENAFNNLKDIQEGGYPSDIVTYAKKIYPMIDKMSLPAFGAHTTGKGLHPNMLDPYWGASKNDLNYGSINEWKAEVSLYFAVGIHALATKHSLNLTALPTEKTLKDWFDLSTLKDNSFDPSLSIQSTHVAFIYNQDDPVFSPFTARLENGDLSAAHLSIYAELIENGNYYHSALPSHVSMGIVDLGSTKHPFWNDVNKNLNEFVSGASQPAVYPEGTKIDANNLPLPNVENKGGLVATVDNGATGSHDDTAAPDVSPEVEKLVELYIAFFGRAAEHSGLEHHKAKLNDLLNSGLSEDQAFIEISNDFWQAGKHYSHMTGFSEQTSHFDFIAKVYENVLGRPDAVENDREGVEFWTQVMHDSGASHGEMVLKVLEGAHHYINERPDDHVTAYVGSLLDNRTDISLFFSQDTISGDLFGDQAIQTGWDVINRINQDAASVDQVKNALVNNTLLDLPEIDLVGTGSLMLMDEGMMM